MRIVGEVSTGRPGSAMMSGALPPGSMVPSSLSSSSVDSERPASEHKESRNGSVIEYGLVKVHGAKFKPASMFSRASSLKSSARKNGKKGSSSENGSIKSCNFRITVADEATSVKSGESDGRFSHSSVAGSIWGSPVAPSRKSSDGAGSVRSGTTIKPNDRKLEKDGVADHSNVRSN
ncbi:Protein of unknown function [Pyronema omphalodes CBS 100304]|uniref:Uncharacterized protein n=1 Tax=Pyronema omphalodes (strain CBS 100304) TaxID=1076935 RepID=U4LXA3_PYROM|nr:Protein of unknown function [Pyronema omphalodes CBS 100304]